ncbi:MAG: hypothetical protein Q8P18_26510 [Pseudomonadota bacterium]|nr:hypothetical protein [Pseudomonadota bacterium]
MLAIGQAALAHVATTRAVERSVTYVFTPLVDVVPGGVPLSAGEAAELSADVRNQVDARDIQQAYARLGSTISLDDLLRGVEGLEASGSLAGPQRERVRAALARAQADHAAVYAVQEEILTLEADLARQGEALLTALPAETRARIEAAGRSPGQQAPR